MYLLQLLPLIVLFVSRIYPPKTGFSSTIKTSHFARPSAKAETKPVIPPPTTKASQ